MRSTLRRDLEGWSPAFIALLLLLLAILLFGLITSVSPPPAIGVSVSKSTDGMNWTLTFVVVPSGLSQNATTLTLISVGNQVQLNATLYHLEGAGVSGVVYRPLQTGPSLTNCGAGDVIYITARYPAGTQYSVAHGGSVLASGILS